MIIVEMLKKIGLSQILVDVLLNLMSNTDDLQVANIKIDGVEELIIIQEQKTHYSTYFIYAVSWLGITRIYITLICGCCFCGCNKWCRRSMFWLWDGWTPSDCIKNAMDRLNVNLFQTLPGSVMNFARGVTSRYLPY